MSSPSQHSVMLRVVAPQSHTPSPQPWNPDTQYEKPRSLSSSMPKTITPEPKSIRFTPSPSSMRKSAGSPVITADRGFNLHTTVDRKTKKDQEEELKREQEEQMKTKEKFESQLQKEGKSVKMKLYDPPKPKPVEEPPVNNKKPPPPKGKIVTPSVKTKIYEHNGVYGPSRFEKGNVWSCCMSSSKDSKGCHVKIVDPMLVDWDEIHLTSPK
eukprot:TRINITY_DN2667_c0_g1_i1.p1 TRINITY_DN2667_c0_g1~~TRINITY_DN2667_c0_g1_i1.p1  ORF type:complete len:212 (+),score=51.23 TRINITY_DN2667_c0_g1_i1:314-949(+)